MKTISSAIFYMSEWQAIFQCEEYSFSEACPYPNHDTVLKRLKRTACKAVNRRFESDPYLQYGAFV